MSATVTQLDTTPADAVPADAVPADATPADATPAEQRPEVVLVADNLISLVRAFGRARTRWLAAARHDVEWSAHVILKVLAHEGPLRAGALAEHLHSDPSTVSRQVAALVKDGLLERQADPQDGRATLLVLTERARVVLRENDETRLAYYGEVLATWSDDDLAAFAGMLSRFTGAYDSTHENWLARMTARAGDRTTEGPA